MLKLFDHITNKTMNAFSRLIGGKAYSRYSDIENFEKVVAASDLFDSGKVHLISLQHIKETLGLAWYGKREKILSTLMERIKYHTDDEDIFFSRSETEHLIIFTSKTTADGQQICGSILKGISKKFLGQCYDRNVILRTAIGKRHGKLLFKDVAYSSKLETKEKPITNEHASVPKLEPFVSHIKPKKERPFELIYKPIWDKKNNVISTFMISIRKNKKNKSENTTSLISYKTLSTPFCFASMIELDKLLLDEVVDMMQEFFNNNFRAKFSIPLHYKTLFNLTRLHTFLFHCQNIPEPLRNYITFQLVGFPEGFPEARMHLIITSLRKFCKEVVIECEKVPSEIYYYKECGLDGIYLNASPKEKLAKNYVEKVNKLAALCAKEEIALSLDGVDHKDELIIIKETELDYISGKIIGNYSEAPNHMAYVNWDDLVKH
ncbi:hypothetical protein [Pseudemcibacter aquimaris]|uniref:hypothetical protein n=1 Tax=Pseudemcibacter aquimaris TaxID=2857064 RepID=UPI00201332BE|nr:hypothetical protein [Pseudemcibacter aquimaris]MCC3860617.1 hypothetical protein [Pseudemcibacter aquimaris]WDU59436.1 hypothetical protein KW060_04075 [Pseudemcibacter aquimaris]